jgi:succinate dehydrogenase hydrophobic anchor subunit
MKKNFIHTISSRVEAREMKATVAIKVTGVVVALISVGLLEVVGNSDHKLVGKTIKSTKSITKRPTMKRLTRTLVVLCMVGAVLGLEVVVIKCMTRDTLSNSSRGLLDSNPITKKLLINNRGEAIGAKAGEITTNLSPNLNMAKDKVVTPNLSTTMWLRITIAMRSIRVELLPTKQ